MVAAPENGWLVGDWMRVGFGSIELVKQFLKDGADVNAKGRYGRTP